MRESLNFTRQVTTNTPSTSPKIPRAMFRGLLMACITLTSSCSHAPDRNALPTAAVAPEDIKQKAKTLSELVGEETILNTPFHLDGHTVMFIADGTFAVDGIIYRCESVNIEGTDYQAAPVLESDDGNVTVAENGDGVYFSSDVRWASITSENLSTTVKALAANKDANIDVDMACDATVMYMPVADDKVCSFAFTREDGGEVVIAKAETTSESSQVTAMTQEEMQKNEAAIAWAMKNLNPWSRSKKSD